MDRPRMSVHNRLRRMELEKLEVTVPAIEIIQLCLGHQIWPKLYTSGPKKRILYMLGAPGIRSV